MARSLTYDRFPLEFTYNKSNWHWTRRKQGHRLTIGRVPICPMSQHFIERYCLRLQLHHVLRAMGYEDLTTVDEEVRPNFQAVAVSSGQLEANAELRKAMEEATLFKFGEDLKRLFNVH